MSSDKVSFDLGNLQLSRTSTRDIKGHLSHLIKSDLSTKVLKGIQADPRYKKFIQSQRDKIINELVNENGDIFREVSASTHKIMVRHVKDELK